jgi:hypothetical protein
MNSVKIHIYILLIILIGCSPPSVIKRSEGHYQFGRPNSHWYVEIPMSKYTVFSYDTYGGGTQGYALLKNSSHPRTDINFFIEPASNCSNAIECRNFRLLQMGIKPSTEIRRVYENDSIAYIESDFNDFGVYGHLTSAFYCKDGDVFSMLIYTNHYSEEKDGPFCDGVIYSIKFKSR